MAFTLQAIFQPVASLTSLFPQHKTGQDSISQYGYSGVSSARASSEAPVSGCCRTIKNLRIMPFKPFPHMIDGRCSYYPDMGAVWDCPGIDMAEQ